MIDITAEQLKLRDPAIRGAGSNKQMEKGMNTIELNTTDEIRIVSDEALGDVAGGFRVYRLDNGGGGVHASGPGIGGRGGQSDPNGSIAEKIVGAVIATAIAVAIFW